MKFRIAAISAAVFIMVGCQSNHNTNHHQSSAVQNTPVAASQSKIENRKKSPPVLVHIEPRYPMDALRNGITGWTSMQFDLSSDGRPINIKVTGGWPEGVFDKTSVRALERWRYRVDGLDESYTTTGLKIQLEYTMSP